MKNIYIIASLLFASSFAFSQVGINTDNPQNTLHVNGDVRIEKIEEVSSTPTYVLVPNDDNVVSKVKLADMIGDEDDATRFVGGTIYVIKGGGDTNDGTLTDMSKIINGGTGTYNMGSVTGLSAMKGRINYIKGNGFTISNPRRGIYDIVFNTPYTEIYGVSSNLLDAYGNLSVVNDNTNPVYGEKDAPGTGLKTTDNSQIGFISNDRIRIKTGDVGGNLSNRSFTFTVIGQ